MIFLFICIVWAAYRIGRWASEYESEKYRDDAIKLSGQLENMDRLMRVKDARIWKAKSLLLRACEDAGKKGIELDVDADKIKHL
jgi:hypothetical protein